MNFGAGPLTSAGGLDIFLAKFTAAGGHQWSMAFGDSDNQSGYRVAVDAAGNIVLTGKFEGSVDFGGGPLVAAGGSDIFLAKFDPAGNPIWSKSFGDSSDQTGYGVASDSSGNIIITGHYMGAVDFGGGPLTSGGGYDIFAAKFTPTGVHLWSTSFGDAADQAGYGLDVDSSGNILITGQYMGTVNFGGGPLTSGGGYDIFLVKLSSTGTHLFSLGFEGAQDQSGYGVTAKKDGNIIITGFFEGTVDFGGGPLTSVGSRDLFLCEFSPLGNHIWSHAFGDSATQTGTGMAADTADNVFTTGYFQGTMDFGGGPLVSSGGTDIFLSKFNTVIVPEIPQDECAGDFDEDGDVDGSNLAEFAACLLGSNCPPEELRADLDGDGDQDVDDIVLFAAHYGRNNCHAIAEPAWPW